MPAYWIARAKINEPVEYKRYTDRVPAVVVIWGSAAPGGSATSAAELAVCRSLPPRNTSG